MKEQAWNYRSSIAKALNGTGEGDSSKVHYYRIDNVALINELESLGYGGDMIVSIMAMYCILSNAYIYNGTGDDAKGMFYEGFTPKIDNIWTANRVKALLISEDVYTGDYPYITKGDLYTKVNNCIKFVAMKTPEEAEFVKSIFDIFLKYITEITEDEFFGMCDLPIAPLPE